MKPPVFSRLLLALFALLMFLPAAMSDAAAPEARRVRLRILPEGRLTIARMRPFPYDGSGRDSVGTLIDRGGGVGELFFPASVTGASPLPMIPGHPEIPLRVEIMPRDMTGTINFCSGEVNLKFDARFEPNTFGIKSAAMAVVTDLTTGVSRGEFREVLGRPLNEWGELRLVGVARVPKTDDRFVNALLSLPTDAVTEMEARLDFAGGRLECPGPR